MFEHTTNLKARCFKVHASWVIMLSWIGFSDSRKLWDLRTSWILLSV